MSGSVAGSAIMSAASCASCCIWRNERIRSAKGERSEYSFDNLIISAVGRSVSVERREDSSSTRSNTWFSLSSRLKGVA